MTEVRREREGERGRAESGESLRISCLKSEETRRLGPAIQPAHTHEFLQLHLELKQPLTASEAAGVERRVGSPVATYLPVSMKKRGE